VQSGKLLLRPHLARRSARRASGQAFASAEYTALPERKSVGRPRAAAGEWRSLGVSIGVVLGFIAQPAGALSGAATQFMKLAITTKDRRDTSSFRRSAKRS